MLIDKLTSKIRKVKCYLGGSIRTEGVGKAKELNSSLHSLSLFVYLNKTRIIIIPIKSEKT